jgi:hypothetical protein
MRPPAALNLFGCLALAAAVLAGSVIWLMLTDPVSMADAYNGGSVSPLVMALARAFTQAIEGLLAYL